MTLQQWCFSYRGRLGRRDFWIWQGIWLVIMALLFTFAGNGWLDTQTAAFCVVCLLWPSGAVLVKRLHDRNKQGYWAFLLILAWMLLAGNWTLFDSTLQWVVGRFIPTLIFVMMLLDLGVFSGSAGENRFGSEPHPVSYFSKPDYQ